MKHPDYCTVAKRLQSFDKWPNSLHQRPEELSAAGFFYFGTGDRVLCYYCGNGLKDWERDDDPWKQHVRWYGECEFVKLTTLLQKEENEENIDEKFLCQICYVTERNTTFVPCGHVVACVKCALSVSQCPICQKSFDKILRIYFS